MNESKTHRSPLQPSLTVRSLGVGLALTAFYAWFAPISQYVYHTAEYGRAILAPGVLFVALALVIVNALLVCRARRFALRSGEIVVVIGMVWLGDAALQFGTMGDFLSIMSGLHYVAAPENRWADYYIAHLPTWINPRDTDGALRYFYNGSPPGATMPWSIWIVPAHS